VVISAPLTAALPLPSCRSSIFSSLLMSLGSSRQVRAV
jgi:hypothetical protein